ncbi:MAG: helix-turn-helix domain-containing protein, partial [Acidimicrobiales bacterium]
RILRTTLEAYFASDQNAVSTSHRLHIHERTVSYRLRSIEEWLDTTIASRRDELAISLRLHRLLDAADFRQETIVPREDG